MENVKKHLADKLVIKKYPRAKILLRTFIDPMYKFSLWDLDGVIRSSRQLIK